MKKSSSLWLCLALALILTAIPLANVLAAESFAIAPSAFALFNAADGPQPIPGMPEKPRTGDGNFDMRRISAAMSPGLPVDPYAVFSPTNYSTPVSAPTPIDVLFDEEFGFPVRHGYRTVTEYYAEMRYLAQEYPHIVKLHEYGVSGQGRPLIGLEISNNPGGNDGRPSAMHNGGIHPREWTGNEMTMGLAWYLVTQYGKVEKVTKLLDTTTCWLLPLFNPDGLERDQVYQDPGTWRGNWPVRSVIEGCDLNRNWAYGWGSNNGSSAGYGTASQRGAGPLSEPETMAVSDVFRSNMILSSVNGHQFRDGDGMFVCYPWAFFINRTPKPDTTGTLNFDNTEDNPAEVVPGVTFRDLGYRLSRLNLYADEYTNMMYAYSGESLDYQYGAMRTLAFLIEYGRHGMQHYLGAAQTYATASYNDLTTGKQREFLLTYDMNARTHETNNWRKPAADITGQPVFIKPERNLIPDYGPGTGGTLRLTTVADIKALPPGALEGKILVCKRANNSISTASQFPDNAAVALAAQAQGAVGVVFYSENQNSGIHGHAHSHFNVDLGAGTLQGNGVDDFGNDSRNLTIPVAGTSKAFMRELWERSKLDPNTTMTFKSSLSADNMDSFRYEFERNLGTFLENISFATEFASHIKGTIKDSAGNLIENAQLDLEMLVHSPIIAGNTANNNWAHLIVQRGLNGEADKVLTQKQTATYNVKGGVYDWSVNPSKQPENPILQNPNGNATAFPDLGYTITASAPGYKSVTVNVKVPEYQMIVDGIDFVLPDADFTVWLASAQSQLESGDTLYVDVMLKGGINYTLAETKVAYDTELFEYVGYENLNAWMGQISREAPNLIVTRNISAINMNNGAPCTEPVRLITLKFAVKDTLAAGNIETALTFNAANIASTPNEPAPVIAPAQGLPLVIVAPDEI